MSAPENAASGKCPSQSDMQAFAAKLGQFRQSLSPQEQELLVALVTPEGEEAEVKPYAAGGLVQVFNQGGVSVRATPGTQVSVSQGGPAGNRLQKARQAWRKAWN